MKDFIQDVIKANREISLLLSKTSHTLLSEKKEKGAGGDITLQIDKLAEDIFIEHLSLYGQIYSEECGYFGKKQENVIVIDPIDGSNNFLSKIPYFGTSVALVKSEKVVCGIVVNLANGDIFIKSEAKFVQGSLFENNFQRVLPNPCSSVGVFERAYKSETIHQKLLENSIKYRSLGALALSLAYARVVDFVLCKGHSREFDIASGWYMCEDLYRKKEKNFLLVSKDKQIFDKISQIITNSR